MRKSVLVWAAVAALLMCGSAAKAQGLYAGILGGYGVTTEKHQSIEPYGVGLGATAGLTLPVVPIYLGARVVWHIGDTDNVNAAPLGSGAAIVNTEISRSYLMYGIDVGYELGIWPIALRPVLGIGSATLNSNQLVTGGIKTKATDSSVYLAPGLALLFKPGLLFAGVEARYNLLTEKNHFNGFVVLGSFGLYI